MNYDEQAAAYATAQVLTNCAGDGAPRAMEIGRTLGTNTQGVHSMIARFVGAESWQMNILWTDGSIRIMTAALADYRRKHGLSPSVPIDPGRPLIPPPPPKPKKAKPPPPVDTSEYGVAKAEYMAALAKLKAAKAWRGGPT